MQQERRPIAMKWLCWSGWTTSRSFTATASSKPETTCTLSTTTSRATRSLNLFREAATCKEVTENLPSFGSGEWTAESSFVLGSAGHRSRSARPSRDCPLRRRQTRAEKLWIWDPNRERPHASPLLSQHEEDQPIYSPLNAINGFDIQKRCV